MGVVNTGTVLPSELNQVVIATGRHVTVGNQLIAINAEQFYAQGFADGSNFVEPSLTSFVPANGLDLGADRNTAKFTPLQFTIVNTASRRFAIWLKFRNSIFGNLVYDSVVGFLPPFDNVASTYIIGTGVMTVLQQSGWQDSIEGVFLGGHADAAIVPVRPGGPGSSTPPDAP